MVDDGRIAKVWEGYSCRWSARARGAPRYRGCAGLIYMSRASALAWPRAQEPSHRTASALAGGCTRSRACRIRIVNDHAGIRATSWRRLRTGLARVYPIGAVSMGSKGEQLTEIGDLRRAGCVAISDDGRPVASALLMRRALEYAGMFDMPVIDHCEDPSLKGDGVAHEGARSSMLGLKGLPAVAETLIVDRGILLSEVTGSRFHVAHMSVATALRSVRDAKARGVRVTCEVAPHHFCLTDAASKV